jgi:RIO kinase 1
MRNLRRLQTAGIKCPDPLEVRENVLVMTFVGSPEGWYVLLRCELEPH